MEATDAIFGKCLAHRSQQSKSFQINSANKETNTSTIMESKRNIRALSAELQELAKAELNEIPARVPEDIETLRQWIVQQPHLRARTDDQFLLGFLRGTKFSLEKAKKKIDLYYTLRANIPEIFNERRRVDDPLVREIVQQGIIIQIPLAATDTGPAITIIRAGAYDITKFKFADIIRVGSMFGEIMIMEDDNATVCGYLEIMDMSKINGTHFFQLQPDVLKKFSTYASDAMPTRQRGIHFINVPQSFEKGFNSLKSLFPAKLSNKISVKSHPEAILEHVPRKYLPIEYGGENGTIQDIAERMLTKLDRYRSYFIEESQYGTDEKLREDSQFNKTNYFGMEGSFRKISID